MQCPKCGTRAIEFADWAKGTNAFRHYCDFCAVALKANTATKLGLVFTFIAVAVCLFVATQVMEIDVGRRGIAFLIFAVVPIMIGAWVGYRFGGYDLDR